MIHFKLKVIEMKNVISILIGLFSIAQVFSQEVCLSADKKIIDVNTINKCAIDKRQEKKEDQNTNDIIISSKRYLKKRVYSNEVVHLISALEAITISDVKFNDVLDTSLLLVSKKEPVEMGVSFDSVEKIPLFESCTGTSLSSVDCFNLEMQKHITNNFIYPEEALNKGIEGDLKVSFIIDVNGKVDYIKVLGTTNNELLENEAKRIVLLLPKFMPGEQNGFKTNVSYEFPMSFTLD